MSNKTVRNKVTSFLLLAMYLMHRYVLLLILCGVVICRCVAVDCRLIIDNADVAMDSIIHIVQHMTPGQRSEVMRILATTDIV